MEESISSPVESTAPVENAPAESSIESSQGSSVDFANLIGEEYSSNPKISSLLENENPAQALAKSLVEAQKMIGQPKIGVPGESASDEDRASFYAALGVPDSADGYGFVKPDDMPDEQYNEEHAQKWANILHENKVPLEAANNLRQAIFQESQELQKAQDAQLNEVLNQSFGDKSSEIVMEIQSLMKQAIPDEAVRQQISDGLQNSPAFALGLGKAIQHMKQTYGMADQTIGADASSSGHSADGLRQEAVKLMSSPAYTDTMNSEHEAVKSRVNNLYQQIASLNQKK